jgi:thiosulfate/3-mercaptopyruvate sulfurtransferase
MYNQGVKLNVKRVFLISALIGITTVACIDILDKKDNSEDKQFTQGLVTTEWLSSQADQNHLVIVDVRSNAEFANGSIPNSINIPFEVPVSTWTAMKGDLLVELPEISELSSKLAENGINSNSQIVLITNVPTNENPYSLSSPTRVALTLAYAGITNAAILDGGIDKWINEGVPVSKDQKNVTPAEFTGREDNSLFADIDYVKSNSGNALIVDARDAEVYDGSVIEPWANKAGHIPGALSLPAPSLWNTDGTYKTKTEIESIVSDVIGDDPNREIIIYCGVGGYASIVWFVLTRILDYTFVKVYDGSSQEWVQLYDMEKTVNN